MNYLIYVNGLGPNYKGDNIYEFIFGDTLEVFGENWESKPANGYPSPPDLEYISKNPRVKLMGRSNKGNLIFKEGINEVKITKQGDIIWIDWFI